MKGEGTFTRAYRKVRVEGFRLQEFLTHCLRDGIRLRRVRPGKELSMTLEIMESDWPRLKQAAGNRYRLTTLSRRGIQPLFQRIFRRKSVIAGLFLFGLLVYFQSLFVYEIRIDGYHRLTETEIRETLKAAGLYEGCRKSRIDLRDISIQMYEQLEGIAYFGISYQGGLARVNLSERELVPEIPDLNQPCHVVAEKAGYIYSVKATGGMRAVTPGQSVEPGDVLITGAVAVKDTTFGASAEGKMTYTHAMGEVWARVPYRFSLYQERYDIRRSETGRRLPGLCLTLGGLELDTSALWNPYETARREEWQLFFLKEPFRLRAAVFMLKETESQRTEREQSSIERMAEAQIRTWAKENLPKSAQILNKSLNFTVRDHIIEISVMLEVLEEIGKEQNFTPPPEAPADEVEE